MPFKLFSTHVTTVVSDPASHIDTHDDVAMSTIQTSLAVLKEGSSLAAKLPYIAPIAGLLLQALTMRDEVKQYKEECKIVMYKLARIAKIIVDVNELCENHNLSEEDLPASLRAILGSLQRELDRIEQVLKKCSKRKGLKGILLRKDLLTRIKQCDVELSNVLQAFHAELSLDTRVAMIAVRREELNVAQTFGGTKALDTLWRITLNAKELMHHPGRAILGPDLLMRSPTALYTFFF
ncbi:hypothetical protein EDB84DRAFT_1186894 [Lactarius hengduanensis]|nr:hypothetical protein EDB84DRAFT_1186894 [Lactarius hengduanensis]